MKKIIILLVYVSCLNLFSQNSKEFLNELNKLRGAENSEKQSIEGESPNVRAAKLSSITAKYQKLESQLRLKYNRIEEQKNQKTIYNQQSNSNINGSLMLQRMQQQQYDTQNNYRQNVNNTLNNLSGSLQAMGYQNIERELKRREKVALNFTSKNSDRIKKVKTLYNQIPKESFNKNINGQYKGHLFIEREYSFLNKQKLITEIPCLIEVINNQVVNAYPYGKKGFKLGYPSEMPSNSYLKNGIVKYNDFNSLETFTIVLIEPYLSDKPKQYKLNKTGTGYVSLFTSKKKDKGKMVWIQEIDKNDNIFREISVPLMFAKDGVESSGHKIPFNTGNKLYYFGEPTQTPYGTFPLFMKVSKSNTKPLKDEENRVVNLKKYRN